MATSVTETQRLRALQGLNILDTPPETPFDHITRIAAEHYGAPIALVSLVDETRQWFKSRVGLDACETPRQISFCSHAIEQDDAYIVQDAAAERLFADNPLVTGEPGIRFYAGCPLIVGPGLRVGTLCVIDRVPRPGFSQAEASVLRSLAALVVDEMELRLARSQAEAASRAKSDFIATMSHEIRTPMTAVIGYAGLLAESRLDERQDECVQQILQSGEHMVRLLNDVLDLARIESGRMTLMPEVFDPSGVAREAVDLFAPQAAAKGLQVVLEQLPGAGSTFRGDRARIRQVLFNLVSNAVKFTERGVVAVRCRFRDAPEAPGSLELEVADSGIGIDPKLHPILFERFVQGDGTDTRRHYGAGLGLAICRELVDLMGGEIRVEGRVGGGTIFRVVVPAAP